MCSPRERRLIALFEWSGLLTELDPKKTLLSIDGIGAFDHIKRKSMLEALYSKPALAPLLPFVRTFYGKDSTYAWYDDEGAPHEILQGEGGEEGEQGDPLMPALYALGQHAALTHKWTLYCTKGDALCVPRRHLHPL